MIVIEPCTKIPKYISMMKYELEFLINLIQFLNDYVIKTCINKYIAIVIIVIKNNCGSVYIHNN